MANFAILFAGCIGAEGWRERYNNDLVFMYKILERENYTIIPLYYDGRELETEDEKIKTFPCTLNMYRQVISLLTKRMQDSDKMIFFVSNHGGFSVEHNTAYINCLGNEGLSREELERDLNIIQGKKVIVLGQCFGGDFLYCNIPNSIIMSANKPGELSFVGHNNKAFDEFLYHFMSYLWGSYPDGSPLVSSQLATPNFLEAFKYAKKNNHYTLNPGKEVYQDDKGTFIPIFEEPQIKINVRTEVYL